MSPEQLKSEANHIFWMQRPWWKKLSYMFSMQKTLEQKFNEMKHMYEWQDSGVKNWRELFNLD